MRKKPARTTRKKDTLFKATPVENSATAPKLGLRRYFLEKYHSEKTPNVLDACQAEGVLWSQLRKEFTVRYLGVDRTPKKGRLTVDSVRLLLQPRLPYDVIDVDTFGSPWRHYEAIVQNIVKPTSVFLTLGKKGIGFATVDVAVIKALGLSKLSRLPPQSLRWKLDEISVASCLAIAYTYGVRIHDAQEVIPQARNARYFGLHLIPATEQRR